MKTAQTKMLRITGCQDDKLWYHGMIGQLVPFDGVWTGYGYRSREPEGWANIVKFADARITTVITRTDRPCNCSKSHTDFEAPQADSQDQAGQSKTASAVEALANIVIGFVVSVAVTATVLPMFGHAINLIDNVQITCIFTFFSLARSYALRRVFNWMQQS